MTIRRLWLLILIGVAVMSVAVNSLILSSLTDRYFKDYLSETYETHISQIIEYSTKALMADEISIKQMAMELEVHLIDPIVEIKLYDGKGDLLVQVDTDFHMGPGMMSKMMGPEASNEVKQYPIQVSDKTLGILNVTAHSLAENTFVARKFKSTLYTNSLIALSLVTCIAVALGLILSKKMSRSLIETAQMASAIQTGTQVQVGMTQVDEVNAIRDVLKDLDVRLRLKEKSRKTLVDGLVHQTRTPLTILKSHLEAVEDGLVEMSPEELAICQNQIENLTTIISNMSGMIDANKEVDQVTLDWVDVETLIRQMTSGLSTQFKRKSLHLELELDGKDRVYTDKFKLSQAVFNLLTNAYKYTDAGGRVTVSTWISHGQYMIQVQDDGPGISKGDLSHIFDAYYRGENTGLTKGDGIGLYILKENIDQIGGNIRVSSQLGLGSTFVIALPMGKSH